MSCVECIQRSLKVEAAGGTHIGCVRQTNEDSYAVAAELGLFLVADGIGGKPGGEVASAMAVEVIRRCIAENDPEETWPLGRLVGANRDEMRFAGSVRRANRAIYDAARHDIGMRGMGTTVAGVLVVGERAYIAHVGDSRVYRLRDGRLAQLTRDHTVVEDFLREPSAWMGSVDDLDPDIACRITRAVGTEPTVDIETRIEEIQAGDVLLVCTDGLWAPVPEDGIAHTLGWSASAGGIAAGLIARAIEHGGPDNVTAVVVRFKGV